MKINATNFKFIFSPNKKDRIILANESAPSPEIKVHGKFMGFFCSILAMLS